MDTDTAAGASVLKVLSQSVNPSSAAIRASMKSMLTIPVSALLEEHHPASSMDGAPSGARLDVARRYNPSKRGRFRGYYDKDGNYHDID